MDQELETRNFIRICENARYRLAIEPDYFINMELAFQQRDKPRHAPADPRVIQQVSRQDGPMRGLETSLASAFLQLVSTRWLQ